MDYKLDGSSTSIAPNTILWQPQQVGTDHNGAPVYSIFYNVALSFDVSVPTSATDWLTAASSGGSHSLTIPNMWSNASFVTFSPVFLSVTEPPMYENVNLAPFGITVTRIIPE